MNQVAAPILELELFELELELVSPSTELEEVVWLDIVTLEVLCVDLELLLELDVKLSEEDVSLLRDDRDELLGVLLLAEVAEVADDAVDSEDAVEGLLKLDALLGVLKLDAVLAVDALLGVLWDVTVLSLELDVLSSPKQSNCPNPVQSRFPKSVQLRSPKATYSSASAV